MARIPDSHSAQIAKLRAAAQRKAGKNSAASLRAQYENLLRQAARKGTVQLFLAEKKVRASVITTTDRRAFFGVKAKIVIPDFGLRDPSSRRWVEKEIAKQRRTFGPETVIFLIAGYKKLLPALLRCGFSVDSVLLEGRTRSSLAALRKKYSPSTDLAPWGLTYRRARRRDISAILRLSKREFSRTPQYGWFCASPAFLAAQRRELTTAVRQSNHSHYIIERGGKFLGYFGSDAREGRPQAGITLILDRKIQGKGIAKTAYLILLEDMLRKRVRLYRGGTSQTSVMVLGEAMGRRMTSTILRYHRGYFPEKHFRPFVS